MMETYQPKAVFGRPLSLKYQLERQAEINARYAKECAMQEIVGVVLPSSSTGFQWALHRSGVRTPNGIQGL